MKFILLATNSRNDRRDALAVRQAARRSRHPAVFEAAFHEVAAVGRAKGIVMPDDAEARMVASTKGLPPDMMASMAHDLIRGGRIELPWLSGKVVALGRQLGVPTPVHSMLYAVLKPFTDGVA